MEWRVDRRALRHGVSRAEIVHALDHQLAVNSDDETVLVVGADPTGALVELVVIDGNRVIHAMRPARRAFESVWD